MIRPTGTYCRDIARELRDTADEQVRCGQPLSEFLGDVLGFGYEPDIEAREADVISELAWLIDRPTCHDCMPNELMSLFECSECGVQVLVKRYGLPGGEQKRLIKPQYCPNCGAEVVE